MRLLEASGMKKLYEGGGEILENVKPTFVEVLKNNVTELELTNDEFATFKLALADCLP